MGGFSISPEASKKGFAIRTGSMCTVSSLLVEEIKDLQELYVTYSFWILFCYQLCSSCLEKKGGVWWRFFLLSREEIVF